MELLPLLKSHVVLFNDCFENLLYCMDCVGGIQPTGNFFGTVFNLSQLKWHLYDHSALELEKAFGEPISRCDCVKDGSSCNSACKSMKSQLA